MLMAFKLVEDYTDELERRLRMLSEKKVEVGVFSQDKHPNTTYTYSNLWNYLSGGDESRNMPARPVTDIVYAWYPVKKSPASKLLKEYFSNIKKRKTEKDMEKVLHGIGKFYRLRTVELFGKSPPLAANSQFTIDKKGANTPLYEEGKLLSKVAYRFDESSANTFEYGKTEML